ncbi:glycosyltransferase [Sandaracinomonas limnophila]|uniref:Glycosyltransferase n=1 Tax=Sandaracinomonas limnophila TaxID=1862386 RepID=A0A437PTM1_9BACT|nr:glycosyltransferase family 4 protein [Sandaracinomonas limnophila]RVU25601.1 glycosyltransferase [Sandaracinomonas limnophila]
MKIGVLYDSCVPNFNFLSANDRRVINICESLNLVGIEADILQPRWRNVTNYDLPPSFKSKIISFGKKYDFPLLSRLHFYFDCFKKIKKNKYDFVIFYNTIIDSIVLMILFKVFGIKFGLEICDKHSENKIMRSGFLNKIKLLFIVKPTESILNKITDFNIVINQSLKRSLPLSTPTLILPVLVDSLNFKCSDKSAIKFRATNNFSDKVLITFCGSYWYYEGSELLVEAIRNLSIKYKNILLLFVGNVSHNKFKPDLYSLVKEYSLEEYIFFTGKLTEQELIETFSATDIFALPQFKDGFTDYAFPTIIGEFASMGKPIIASNTGELATVFTDQKDVLFFEDGNVEQLTNQIERLVLNLDLRQKLGDGARNISQNIFGLKINGLRLFNFFHNL